MLTAESYIMAWTVYMVATLIGLLILYLWIGPRMSAGARLTLLLLLAAMALTPARPDANLASWAPAVIVAAFDLLTDGTEAALRPLRPMLIMSAMSLALCLFIFLGRRWRVRGRHSE